MLTTVKYVPNLFLPCGKIDIKSLTLNQSKDNLRDVFDR